MFKRLRLFASILVCSLLTLTSCVKKNISLPSPQINAAPDFTLKYLNGKLARLSEQRGKVVLVHFWASWCTTCVYELGTLENLYSFMRGKDFEILAIAIDDKWPAIQKLQDEKRFSIPLLFDETGKIREAYRVRGIPQTFIINKNGEMIEFLEPETGKLVTRTSGPQRWDQESVASYFTKLVENG